MAQRAAGPQLWGLKHHYHRGRSKEGPTKCWVRPQEWQKSRALGTPPSSAQQVPSTPSLPWGVQGP